MKLWLALCLAFGWLAATAHAADLSAVDKTIGKEPVYKGKPGYALLVFGPEAKTRVWLVEDRERIYVDRNADGDLTGPGESVEASKVRAANSSYRDKEYAIGTLTPSDKTGPHTDFKITAYSEDNKLWNYVLKLKLNGKLQQFAGWKPIFKESPAKAPILHFGGPLAVQPLRFAEFSLKEKKPELHLRFFTRGLGEFSAVSLGYEAVPQEIEPVALIEWPGSKSETVKLLSRC
jgi:hypothetical protein